MPYGRLPPGFAPPGPPPRGSRTGLIAASILAVAAIVATAVVVVAWAPWTTPHDASSSAATENGVTTRSRPATPTSTRPDMLTGGYIDATHTPSEILARVGVTGIISSTVDISDKPHIVNVSETTVGGRRVYFTSPRETPELWTIASPTTAIPTPGAEPWRVRRHLLPEDRPTRHACAYIYRSSRNGLLELFTTDKEMDIACGRIEELARALTPVLPT